MGLLSKEPDYTPINTPGNLAIYQEGHIAELDTDEWAGALKPEVSFSRAFYLNDHDSRLYLSSDTYVQLLMGAGMVISGDDKEAIEALQRWIDDTGFEEKVEDGAHSYIIAGNLLFEKFPLMADVEEIDITTIKEAKRLKNGKVTKYIQHVNNKDNELAAKKIAHLKFTNRRRELWGRSMYQSIISPKIVDEREIDSAVEEMWKIENSMVKIFQSYASPIMMVHFEDAGEDFIKDQQQRFEKIGAGAKILTDKAFNVKIFEVNPASKYDKYIEHMEKDVIETGSQFANQIFTAGFTARASSENSTDVIKLKIKRIQKRFGKQLKQQILDEVLEALGFDPAEVKLECNFQFNAKSELTVQDIQGLFEKGTLTRPEVRKYVNKNTDVEIDTDDMADEPPITSVTPTDDMRTNQPVVDPNLVQIPRESLEKLIQAIAEKIPNPRGRTKEEASPDTILQTKLKIIEKLLSKPKEVKKP